MWLKVGEVGYLEVDFWHSHGDSGTHLHDALVATVEAHALAHRLGSYGELALSSVREALDFGSPHI